MWGGAQAVGPHRLRWRDRAADAGPQDRLLSRADRTPTLIFDEIDQGIGGRIGTVVGTKLWRLTAKATEEDPGHQVLCITHLPQLAGFGDVHYRVAKEVVEGRTVTHVTPLPPEERVAELAQMLGTNGAAAVRGAHEILEQAAATKTRLGGLQPNDC